MGVMSEFRDFAMRGNVVDLAVGVIIGGAFGKIVSVLVDKVMMPPLGLVMGGIDFADKKLVIQSAVMEADKVITPEVALGYGEFINALIQFIIVAWALFLVIKAMNRIKKKAEAAPPPPAAPPEDVVLLREIRDLLKKS
jgi:large conductance mechanosensitive channel